MQYISCTLHATYSMYSTYCLSFAVALSPKALVFALMQQTAFTTANIAKAFLVTRLAEHTVSFMRILEQLEHFDSSNTVCCITGSRINTR